MVAREVRTHLDAVQACYFHFWKSDPSLRGRVVVHWTISADGSVSRVKIEENAMGSAAVADCVKDVVSHWRFPALDGGPIDVSFPFAFKAAPPDAQRPPTAGTRATREGQGDIDPALVMIAVDAHLGVVRECYEHALRRDPSLHGKVVAHWTISTAGTVSAADIEENTMGSPDVADCIRQVVCQWQFPAPTGGPIDVSFPFVFESTP
jgi:TonB family protein